MADRKIEAIPTTYNGVTYKSRLEARWALFLTNSGIAFQYEPNGDDTLPDFLIAGSLLLEVKGSFPNKEYISWLGKQKVHMVAVGGFFKGQRPLLVSIHEMRGKTLLRTEQFSGLFPNYPAFLAACNHRFDL